MASPRAYNLARMTTATTGTGTITLGSAVAGFLSFAAAGVQDGDTVYYGIKDGTASEVGLGTYASSATTLARTNVLKSTNSDAAINLSGTAEVYITAVAESLVGRRAIWVPATAMVPRTTNGAAFGSVETSTNKVMIDTLDFDPSTTEYAQFEITMPESWDLGTVTFAPVWSHPSTTTNFGVVFGLAGVAVGNGDALEAAFGTAQTSTDTGGTTDTLYRGPESSAVTIAGTPAAGDTVKFQVNRTVSDGSDDMAVDARLHGVMLFITTNGLTD
ncbi:MAG: hypothetical protein AB7O43_17715 [Hyphomicrobiaceae bacterium]